MKVPHEIVGRTQIARQGLDYLRPAVPDLSAIGRGLGALGAGLTLMQDRVKEREDKTDKFSSLRAFSDFESQTSADLLEMKRKADPSGKGFVAQANDYYSKREAQFLASLPQDLQEEFRFRAGETKQRVFGDSLVFQYQQGDAYYREGIDKEYQKALVGLDPTVGGDPKQLEVYRARVFETIDASDLPETSVGADASGKPLLGKLELKERISIGLEGVTYKQAYKNNKRAGAIDLNSSVGQVIDEAANRHGVPSSALRTIAWIESKGNPNAKNPNSSAGGLFQQIDSNARDYGVGNRFDAGESAEGAARFAADNRKAFQSAFGRDPTDGEYYLMHQQGPQGAINLLRNPDAPAASIVGRDAVRLNGGDRDMTAGEFANLWMKKAGDANPDLDSSSAFSNLPYEDRIALRRDADAEINRENNEAAERERLRVDAQRNGLMNGILDGTRGQADIDAGVQEGWLGDYDARAKAQNLYDKKIEDYMSVARFNQQLESDTAVFDPLDEQAKKDYNLWAKNTGSAENLAEKNQEYVTGTLLPVVQRTSDIPTDVIGLLTGQIRSADQSQMLFAFETLAQLQDMDERAFNMRVDDDLAAEVAYYRSARGMMHPDQIQEVLNGGHTQAERQRRRGAFEEAQTILAAKDNGITALASKVAAFTDSLDTIFTAPSQIASPAFARELNEDYQTAFTEMYTLTGDEAKSDAHATQVLNKYWAVSAVGGEDVIMKYPPEAIYPKVVGSHAWLGLQARRLLEIAPEDTFQLVSDEQTRRELDEFRRDPAAGAPSYMAIVKDASGVMRLQMDGTVPKRIFFEQGAIEKITTATHKAGKAVEIELKDLYRELNDTEAALTVARSLPGAPVPEGMAEDVEALKARIKELEDTQGKPWTPNY